MKELFRLSHGVQDGRMEDALRDYSLEVYEGDILYIQGMAGSGIRALAEVFAGDSALSGGQLFLDGREVKDYNRSSAWQYRIYTITADRDLVETLTVAENLEAVRYLPFAGKRYQPKEAVLRTQAYLDREQVKVDAGAPLWRVSHSDRSRLSILKAKMHGARLIVLDTAGGFYDGKSAEELCALIRRANQEGITFVILAEHYTMFAEIASRIQIISDGIDLKDFGPIDEKVRKILHNQVTAVPHRPAGAAKEELSRSFLGLYDYEWEMEDGLWPYLRCVREQNPGIWDTWIAAAVPGDGESFCRNTVVIPKNSGESLFENLSVADNLLLPIPERAGKTFLKLIQKNIRANVAERFYRQTGIPRGNTTVGQLTRIQKKILSIYRWELGKPEIMILENPYGGMTVQERDALRRYLQDVSQRGIRVICFSKSMEELRRDCGTVVITQNGRSAKIATF